MTLAVAVDAPPDYLEELENASIKYAKLGWNVLEGTFSLLDGHVQKRPLTDWRRGPSAYDRATTNSDIIEWRFGAHGHRVQWVGIATGPASGVVVLDFDPQNGGDPGDLPGELPDTLTARTPSGGLHYYFEAVNGLTNGRGSLPKGFDFRGEGGLVVAAPSVNPHVSSAYEWVNWGTPPAKVPDWLLTVLGGRQAPPVADPARPPVGPPTARDVKHAIAALNDECEILAGPTEGENGGRNISLNSAALRLFRLANAGTLEHAEVLRRLQEAGQACGLERREVAATLKSARRKADAEPPVFGPDGLEGRFAGDEEPADEDQVLEAIRDLVLASNDNAADHLGDLVDDAGLQEIPEPQFIIDGWIPRGVYSVIYGQPGVKKTFATLGMALAVRRGTRWQDHPTRQGAALMYQGEGLAQLRNRVGAWQSRYPKRPDQTVEPGAYLERFVDLTKAEGVAAIVRTVRGYEAQHGTRVELLIIDPLVEFMTGDENGEGMDKATKGLRALAMYLNIGVLVVHHTNASGERARGADFHRMRAGAFIAMEDLGQGELGLWQAKQKNAEQVAMTLSVVPEADSLVLEIDEEMPVSAYVSRKEGKKRRVTEEAKAQKATGIEGKILDALRSAFRSGEGRVAKGKLSTTVGGNHNTFQTAIDQMMTKGLISIDIGGSGKTSWVSVSPAYRGAESG